MATPEEIAEMDDYLTRTGRKVSGFTQRGQAKAMCHGMCLDWIRRILGGKQTRFDELEKDRPEESRASFTIVSNILLSVAEAVGAVPTEKEARRQARFSKMREIHELRSEALERTQKIVADDLAVLMRQGENVEGMNGDQVQALLKRALEKKRELETLMVFGAQHPTFWKTFAQLWNDRRAGRAEKAASFMNIEGALVGEYIPVLPWPDASTAWAKEMSAAFETLGAGKCASILFAGSGARDHAVAIHKLNDAQVEFFDPNFGEFVFSVEFGEVMGNLISKIYDDFNKYCTVEFKAAGV